MKKTKNKSKYRILTALELFNKAGFAEPEIALKTDHFRAYQDKKRNVFIFYFESKQICSVVLYDSGYLVDVYDNDIHCCSTISQVVTVIKKEYARLENHSNSIERKVK